MKYAEVAVNVKRLVEHPPSHDEFIYELLLAYNTPKATVARLKNGQLNRSQEPGEVLLKKKVWFKKVPRASSLPGGAECPQDAGGTVPNDGEQAGRSLYGYDHKKDRIEYYNFADRPEYKKVRKEMAALLEKGFPVLGK